MILNLPEAELFFDDEGHVNDAPGGCVHPHVDRDVHGRGEAVARLFHGLDIPVEAYPSGSGTGRHEVVRVLAISLGHRLTDSVTRKDLQQLDKTVDTPAARAVHSRFFGH